jgi:hypothetical protein
MKGGKIRAKFKRTLALWAGILIIIAGITLLPSATKEGKPNACQRGDLGFTSKQNHPIT